MCTHSLTTALKSQSVSSFLAEVTYYVPLECQLYQPTLEVAWLTFLMSCPSCTVSSQRQLSLPFSLLEALEIAIHEAVHLIWG